MRARSRLAAALAVTLLAACSENPGESTGGATNGTSDEAWSETTTEPRSEATRDPDGVLRLVFLGNSHTARHDVPGTVAALLRTALPGTRVQAVRAPTLLHLQHRATHAPTLDLLADGSWDVVVLQAQDYSTSGRHRYPTDGAAALVRRAREAGAVPVLFAEWPRRGIDETGRIVATYAGIEGGACLPPVPEAFDAAADTVLHAADGNHASPEGAYLAAAVLAQAVTGRPPDVARDVALPGTTQRALLRVADAASRRTPPDRACAVSPPW